MSSSSFEKQVTLVQSWLSGRELKKSKRLLAGYYDPSESFRGAGFDVLAGQGDPHAIGPSDLAAVRRLSVGFPRQFSSSVKTGSLPTRIHQALAGALEDTNERLENLSNDRFEELLGEGSDAWVAWDELSAFLKAQGARAPFVGASKLLAAKRPRLIPLEDSLVRGILGARRREIWVVIHRLLRNKDIRRGLTKLRTDVPDAKPLPLARVLDVLAWRAGRGDRIA